MQTHQEFRHSTIALGDFVAGGVIGVATATIDVVAAISIAQSTASQTLSLPTPSDTAHSLLTQINNVGTVAFTMHGTTIDAKSSALFVFTSGLWHSLTVKNTDLYRDRGMPNTLLTGGGVIKLSAAYDLSWANRFIFIGGGSGSGSPSANGYFDIQLPAAGTTITGVGAQGNVTVTAAGIQMPNWAALWYELPTSGSFASIPANFRLAGYSASFTVPNNWVLVAVRNSDFNYIKLGTGEFILPNTILGDFPDIRRGGTVQAGTVAGGVIPLGYSVYAASNANWNPTVTLPTSANRVGDIFTINHQASINANVLTTNTNMAAPYTLTLTNRGAAFIWLGSLWSRIA
jgi:hypothetical protein